MLSYVSAGANLAQYVYPIEFGFVAIILLLYYQIIDGLTKSNDLLNIASRLYTILYAILIQPLSQLLVEI